MEPFGAYSLFEFFGASHLDGVGGVSLMMGDVASRGGVETMRLCCWLRWYLELEIYEVPVALSVPSWSLVQAV